MIFPSINDVMTDNRFQILEDMLLADRSVRRFDESHGIEKSTVERIVGLVRLCASGRNIQPLRYRIVTAPHERESVFPALAWAGYYKDWDGPGCGERPSAYIVQCIDTEIANDCLCDDGLHLQALTLGAVALGISCCIIKALDSAAVAKALGLSGRYRPRYVLAMGYASERVRIVEMTDDGDCRYYRDADDNHCVPKRPVESLII